MDEDGERRILGANKGRSLRIKKGAATGMKVELGAGAFDTGRKPPGFFKTHGADLITEYVHGDVKDEGWGKRQQTNATVLANKGAILGTGVDVHHLREDLEDFYAHMKEEGVKHAGSYQENLRKLKFENPHKAMGEKSLLDYKDIFGAADQVLARKGVMEFGFTGPYKHHQEKTWHHVEKAAKSMGFELVEERVKKATSHTFSQQTEGMHDLTLTQRVYARKGTEARQVRSYLHDRYKVKTQNPSIGTSIVAKSSGKKRAIIGKF